MNAFSLAILLSTVALAFQSPSSNLRGKRSLGDLKEIIRCATGRSYSAYRWYGCYCGSGGRGKPKDKADKCCQKHDCCYAEAEEKGCEPKKDSYKWKCEDKMASCDGLKKCEKMLCECDRDFGKCLKDAPYRWYYAVWPNWLCGSRKSCDA
uniref:phospholipase A2-like n=1 Tax=Doryrhamphus excisus TaxID=161450 RepID=UPI0025ADDCF8|nr:phospholipase A2-like [Doryrhamphus excisus]